MNLFSRKKRTAAEIGAEISNVEQRIAAAESELPALQAERREALLADDSATADSFSARISAAQSRLNEMRERIALLREVETAAEQHEANAVADAKHRKAQAALRVGHECLKTAALQMAAVADTMEKLAALNAYIADVNSEIGETHGRVDGIYLASRFIPEKSHQEVRAYWVYPGLGGVQQQAAQSVDGKSTPPKPIGRITGYDEKGKPIEVQPELHKDTVTVMDSPRFYAGDIDELVELPGMGAKDAPLWDEARRLDARQRSGEIVAALLARSAGKAA